ncbi:MAG: hypothetical protein WC564_01165 [Patescibacteria group bacterium]
MINNKIAGFSSLLFILILSVFIILFIMIIRGGSFDQAQKTREIKEGVKIDLQRVEKATDNYNQDLGEILNE